MIINGPRHEKTCLRWFADNKGPDQPAHACRWHFKNLASPCSWGDWFESRFVGNPKDRFFSWQGLNIIQRFQDKTFDYLPYADWNRLSIYPFYIVNPYVDRVELYIMWGFALSGTAVQWNLEILTDDPSKYNGPPFLLCQNQWKIPSE